MQLTFRKHTLRFKQPAGTSRGVYRTRTVWYVTACDAEGNYGIGECAPLPDLSCDAMPDEQYEAVLAEACRLTAEAEGLIPYAFLRPYPSILFGIETALLSLQGCKQSANPYRLFDTTFSRGETGTRINGLVWMGSYEEMMARMEEKLALGFRCIKIKIGAIDWEREISLIRALRERFPREVVEIRVDANGGFTPEVAMNRLCELARYDIHSIEQPVRQHQWETMATLCRETPIPIALDEELIGVNDLKDKARLLDTICPQYIILKPSLHGGLSGSEEWIRLAQERGIGYWVTSALESNVGLNAIAQWQGTLPTSCTLQGDDQEEEMPQGLGTGQLFVENYDAVHLRIDGERLWCGAERDQAFEAEYRAFLTEWQNESPTITVHTSGSTGTPQPIVVEKSRMTASARLTLDYLGIPAGTTALLCMPLRYIAGKMMVVRALAGHLRLQKVAPSSHPLADAAHALLYGIDLTPYFLALTPMQAVATLSVPTERAIFERIPVVIIGGGAISPELLAQLQGCQGRVFSTYGMTETLSHIALQRLNGSEASDAYTPLPGVTITTNTEGCLVIDAPAVCSTPLTTHDLCTIRTDGTFIIHGRTDNVINSGGIKLSLEILEAKLGDIGVPYVLTSVADERLGEALTLLYIYKGVDPSEDVITNRLEKYECPRHLIRVDALPLTETGKPARAEAKKLAQAAVTLL